MNNEKQFATRTKKKWYELSCDLANIIKSKGEEVEKLEAENEKLRECVEFYADFMSWSDLWDFCDSPHNQCVVVSDDVEDFLSRGKNFPCGGKRARQTLKDLGDK